MEAKKSEVIYNPFFDKTPVGAVAINQTITMNIKWPSHFIIWDISLIIEDDYGEIYQIIDCTDSITFTITNPGIFWYYFRFTDTYGTHFLVSDDSLNAYVSNNHEYLWQLSIHLPLDNHPHWYKGKIIYQIMVDRFYKGGNNPIKKNIIFHDNWNDLPNYKPVNGKILNNDFFGGDLRGIIAKLPYLSSLNVSVIYLNPIFEAASNHKYDTGNFMKIDEMFGTEEDFKELVAKAKAYGMRIILDGVFNHVGDDSLYFNKYNHYPELGAYNSKLSVYYDWFLFIDYPDDYMSWWGIKTLPTINQDSITYLQYIDAVLKKYLRLGASGYRLDVVDELTDKFVERITAVVKEENKGNIIIGEVWEDASNKVAYGQRKHYFNGKQLDSVMNYVFKRAIISYLNENNVIGLRNNIRKIINNYPKDILDTMMNVLDTHDTMRIINNFAYQKNLSRDEEAQYLLTGEELAQAISKMKLATILQYTLPGIPSIYYGDEAGLQGFDDPFCRKTFPWDNINLDLYNWYKRLGEIRKDSIFIDGIYQEYIARDNIFAFYRFNGSRKCLIVINNSNEEFRLTVNGYEMITKKEIDGLILPPISGAIIKIN